LFRQVLDEPGCPRDRASHAAGLATALSAGGDHAGAVAVAIGFALPVLDNGVSSRWCLDQLEAVAAEAGPVREEEQLRGRLDAARRRLPAPPDFISGASAPGRPAPSPVRNRYPVRDPRAQASWEQDGRIAQ
jgi:hypothetical protein